MHAAMLTAMGIGMLLWRPCRSREGRAPRSAIAMLLLAAAAVWVGSFSLAVHLVADGWSGLPGACVQAWRELVTGPPWGWRTGALAAWTLAFPIGAAARASRQLLETRRLRRRLLAVGRRLPGHPATVVVADLGTPAVTIGVARPVVAVDAVFWADASWAQRAVVLCHEQAHRHGRHGLVEAAAVVLAAPLAPLPAAGELVACVRRHLEALADDAAARHTGREVTGRTLAQMSLAAAPAAGLAVAGDGLWRARRLLTAQRPATVMDRLTIQGSGLTMMVCAGFATVQLAALVAGAWVIPVCPL